MMSMSGATAPSGHRVSHARMAKTPSRTAWIGICGSARASGSAKFKGNKTYHTFNWRGWVDFGTGALGDMACHTCNLPFRGTQTRLPHRNRSRYLQFHQSLLPQQILYPLPIPRSRWPRPGHLPLVQRRSNPKPPAATTATTSLPPTSRRAALGRDGRQIPGSGCLMVGDKGQIFSQTTTALSSLSSSRMRPNSPPEQVTRRGWHPPVHPAQHSQGRGTPSGVDRRLQRSRAGLFQFRHRSLPHRNHAPGLRRHLRRQETRMGRSEHGRQERSRSLAIHPPRIPQRMGNAFLTAEPKIFKLW